MGRHQIIAANPDEISRQYPMCIMAVDEYMDEPENRKRMTPKPATKSDCDISDDEWREMICIIARYAGPSPSGSGSALADFLRESATHLEQAYFRLQIDRAIKFLNGIRDIYGSDFSSTKALLLPISFSQRIELTLGLGEIPVAWIMVRNVLA